MPDPDPTASSRPARRTKTRILAVAGGLSALAGLALSFSLWPGLGTLMADSPSTLKPAPIDGTRAFGYLVEICKMGPHPAGAAPNAALRDRIARHFTARKGVVREQPFDATDPVSGKPVAMVNLIGSWFPERVERVVLAAHYDSRPFPDEDPDPAKRKTPFIGANDPASGIALLMEIANHLGESKTPWGVDLVLFDGEELVYGGGRDQTGEYFLGSKHFGREYVKARRAKVKGTPHFAHAIVLDLIGGKDMEIGVEDYSADFAPKLVKDVWSVAKGLGVKQFRDRHQGAVQDDHLALYNSGIPAIDIIDFGYPHWHKASDLPENCSPASLEAVGRVVTAWLNKPKPRR